MDMFDAGGPAGGTPTPKWYATFDDLAQSTADQFGQWFAKAGDGGRMLKSWYRDFDIPSPTMPRFSQISGQRYSSLPNGLSTPQMMGYTPTPYRTPLSGLSSSGNSLGGSMLSGGMVSGMGSAWRPMQSTDSLSKFMGGLQDRINREQQARMLEQLKNQQAGASGGMTPGGSGSAARNPGFGQFSKTPGVYSEIDQAATATGVPANFLMAIIAAESSGDWHGNNRTHPLRGEVLYPYVGVFRSAATSRVPDMNFASLAGNRAGQIMLLARVLRSQYDELKRRNPSWDWLNVASYHYSGRPVPDGWADEGGNGTNNAYAAKIKRWWTQLDQYNSANGVPNSGGGVTGGPGGQMSSGMSAIWGGGQTNITQEFGPTSFSRQNAGLYSYGSTLYGMAQPGHTGLDIGVPLKTRLYSPGPGTVTCAGTGVGNGGGTGCSAFGSEQRGPGSGRIQINLDNGHIVILGHSYSTNVPLGTRVKAGDFVGLSGTANGPHIHLEYRIKDPSTPSGYRIVDPRKYISGGLIPGGGGGAGHFEGDGHNHGAAPAATGSSWWSSLFNRT